MKRPKYQRLMRFLKDNGIYIDFIRKVCAKHCVKFGKAEQMIIDNPNIPELIGIYRQRMGPFYWAYDWDDYTKLLSERFDKYNPYTFNIN